MISRESTKERIRSTWYWVAAIAILSDGVTTIIAIQNPILVESNPLPAFVLSVGGVGSYVAYNLGQAILPLFTPSFVSRRTFRAVCVGVAIYFLYCATSNVWHVLLWK